MNPPANLIDSSSENSESSSHSTPINHAADDASHVAAPPAELSPQAAPTSPTSPTSVSAVPAQRFHGLDRLRGSAMVLGVVLHAVTPHTTVFSYAWPVQDVARSPIADALFHWIHSFRMPLFFLLSGFLAHLVVQKYGYKSFLKRRWQRVGIPLLLAVVTLAPLTKLAEEWSRSVAGGAAVNIFDQRFWNDREAFIAEANLLAEAPTEPTRVDSVDSQVTNPSEVAPWHPEGWLRNTRFFTLGHLWFLYYLLVFAVVTPWLAGRFRAWCGPPAVQWVDHRLARWLPTVLAPLLLAIPTYPFLFIMLSTGIGTPFSVLLPFPVAILLPELNFYGFYLIYFLFGWILHRQTHLLSNVARQWPRWMGLGAGCFLIAYFITKGLDFNPWQDGFWQRRFSGLAFYSVATAAFCLGFTGLFHRNFNRDSKSWRFLSNASYWIYLSHLPLVFMASAIVARWPMAWGWKLLLTTACVTGICVMTYILFVRNRWLGKMLDSSPPK